MASIRSKNTRPELALGKTLWKKGLRYRKHYKITGSPDFVFVSKKIAVFVDGDYWHGNNWRLRKYKNRKEELDSYSEYWKKKILRNIERDKAVNKALKKQGWKVLRVWESQIKKDIDKVTHKILDVWGKAIKL